MGIRSGLPRDRLYPLALALLIVVIAAAGIATPREIDARHSHGDSLGTWLGILVLLAAFILIAGKGVTGLWRGLLIDERNRISLSRFQLVLWTLLILSAYIAGALVNIGHHDQNPLSISIPKELWLAMGISVGSLVGSPLVQVLANKTPADDGSGQPTVGQLVANPSREQAKWTDLFMGEETGNASHLDLTRVQMLLFTVILVVGYGVALGDPS
jgi:hypothetical protein